LVEPAFRYLASRRQHDTPETASQLQSQNHRITAWSGLEGTSVGHPVQPTAEAGSPRAGCTGPWAKYTPAASSKGRRLIYRKQSEEKQKYCPGLRSIFPARDSGIRPTALTTTPFHPAAVLL